MKKIIHIYIYIYIFIYLFIQLYVYMYICMLFLQIENIVLRSALGFRGGPGLAAVARLCYIICHAIYIYICICHLIIIICHDMLYNIWYVMLCYIICHDIYIYIYIYIYMYFKHLLNTHKTELVRCRLLLLDWIESAKLSFVFIFVCIMLR